jgi:hypothetical protein
MNFRACESLVKSLTRGSDLNGENTSQPRVEEPVHRRINLVNPRFFNLLPS